ncbi:Ubiquitin-like-specific protease 2 [Pseudozyma hubeiensis]|nr:Ubiquitin-like-specific protease 2 [Pseudozyma hubeiensis]
MARNRVAPSWEDHDHSKALHGIGGSTPKPKVPIHVPRVGSVPGQTSPPHSRSRKRASPHWSASRPSHHTTFIDTLHNDDDSARRSQGSLGTARRSSLRSSDTRPASHSSRMANSSPADVEPQVYIDVEATFKQDKGKAKARDMPPRITRSARGRLSHEDAILVESDDDVDDADDVQLVPSIPSSREIKHNLDGVVQSSALQAKDRRRKDEASSSKASASSAAQPETFYSKQSHGPGIRNNRRRPDGPISLEEPDDGRSNGRNAFVLVPSSPELNPVIGTRHSIKHKPPASSRTRMVDRMHKKMPSPNAASTSQRRSSSSMAPSTSQTSPRTQLTSPDREPSANEQVGSSRGAKRMRTEASTTSMLGDSSKPSSQTFEVRLQAIVVSDMWKSRERDHAAVWVNPRSLQCGVAANHRATIRYSDIYEVLTNTPDVKGCGIMCLTLTPGCESARELQKTFPDFDPCASGDAAQIQMIARDSSSDDLSDYAHASASIVKRLRDVSNGTIRTRWLDEPGVKSKITLSNHVKESPWPGSITISAQEPQEPQPRKARTLITPGSNRPSESFTRGLKRTNAMYESHAPRKKTFDLQPPSPKVSAPSGRARDASPSLPSLTVPKAKTAEVAPPKMEVKRPPVSHEDGTILQYPYEGTGAVSLRHSDFDKLLDGGLLNDVAIDFGIKVILADIRARDPTLADSIYVFNTFFFSILMSDSVENSYAKLRRWTAKEDLFSKKYIVIPVNENYHWYLALIVNPAYILVDQDRDSNSEKDKDEVAASLMSPSPASRRQSPAREQVAATEHASLESEKRVEDKPAANSEPGTPPLPSTSLPSHPADSQSEAAPVPMDVDAEPCADGRTKRSPDPANLEQTLIITLDSLGQRHAKLGNRLFEYLWREAWDKKKPTLSASAQPPKPEPKREPKAEAHAQSPPAPKDTSKLQLAASCTDASKTQASDSLGDASGSRDGHAVAEVVSMRSVPVQDKRQANGAAATKLTEAEAWGKSLPKAAYINASVPEQPNFCDCGIYLLHYVDRFFRDPEKLLASIVDARSRIAENNKANPAMRREVRNRIESRIRAEWQAGEVSSKRAYWRSKVFELSEGWVAHRKMKEEKVAKSEEDEAMAASDVTDATAVAPQQVQPPTAQGQVKDTPMPDVEQAVHVAAKSNPADDSTAEQDPRPLEQKTAKGLGIEGASPDEIERSVHDCARGEDVNEKAFVENVLAQALAKQTGPLSLEHLGEPQREDFEHEQRSASERIQDLDLNARTFPLTTIADGRLPMPMDDSADSKTQAPAQEEFTKASPTLSASSTISRRRGGDEQNAAEQQQQEHEQEQGQRQPQSREMPSPFGATMLPSIPSSWPDRPPSLSFSSSKNHLRWSQEAEDLAGSRSRDSGGSTEVDQGSGGSRSPSSSVDVEVL